MQVDRDAAMSAPPLPSARRFTWNSAFGTLAGLLTALSSVLASVIVAHALGVAATGVVAFAMWIVMVAAAIGDLGVQASLARYLPELIAAGRTDAGRWLTGRLWRWLACSCAAIVFGFDGWAAWRWQSGAASGAEAARWALIGVACALQVLTGFTFGYLRGVQRFDRLALLTVVCLICQLLGVATGSALCGANGALAGYCAGSVAPAVVSLRHAVSPGLPCPELGTRVRRFALYAWAGALSGTFVWSRAELFFLERAADSTVVGLFTVAVTFANLASQGPMLLTAGLLPYFAENFGRGAVGEMREAYAAATRVLAFLVLPVCFGMAAILPALVPLMYGRDFAGAIPAATVLVLASGVGAIASVGTTLVMAMDRSDFVFASGLVSAALAIGAGFTVIPAFGLMGAAWSRAAIQVAAVVMGGGFVFWRLRFPPPIFDLAKLLVAATVCGIAARSVLALGSGLVLLTLAIVGGAVAYAAAVRALGALQPRDGAQLRMLCGVFPARTRGALERGIALLEPGRIAVPVLATARNQSVDDAD